MLEDRSASSKIMGRKISTVVVVSVRMGQKEGNKILLPQRCPSMIAYLLREGAKLHLSCFTHVVFMDIFIGVIAGHYWHDFTKSCLLLSLSLRSGLPYYNK